MREAFAVERSFCTAKASHIFQQKMLVYLRYEHLKINEMLTNDIVSFEPDPSLLLPIESNQKYPW